MPYASNSDLPKEIRDNVPSEEGKKLFRRVFNSEMRQGADEGRAFAAAWAALRDAGYERNDEGLWVKKNLPSSGDVHVDSTSRKKPKKTTTNKEEDEFQPPKAAQRNAQKALDWREKYGDEVKGGTEVGWNRARQLASGEPVSRDVLGRMASFNRHRKNGKVDPEHSGEPWKDAGHVAWLLWGGDEGVDWAMNQMDKLEKRQESDHRYTLRREAEAAAPNLGLSGAHPYESPEGEIYFMPGETHEQFVEALSGEKNAKSMARMIAEHLGGLLGAFEGGVYTSIQVDGMILKADNEQRMVWGWASVITTPEGPVYDSQGDAIEPDEMIEYTTDFMMSDARIGKSMHDGPTIGQVVHSLPLTYPLAKALGIQTPQEGWIVAMKVFDDDTWEAVKSGELSAFSIGGRGTREEIVP